MGKGGFCPEIVCGTEELFAKPAPTTKSVLTVYVTFTAVPAVMRYRSKGEAFRQITYWLYAEVNYRNASPLLKMYSITAGTAVFREFNYICTNINIPTV